MVISYSMKKHQRYVLCYKMRNNYNEKVVEPIMKSRNMELVNDIVKLPSKSANTWTQTTQGVFFITPILRLFRTIWKNTSVTFFVIKWEIFTMGRWFSPIWKVEVGCSRWHLKLPQNQQTLGHRPPKNTICVAYEDMNLIPGAWH